MNATFAAPAREARVAGREPRVLFLADHLGYPGGAVHGVTTYLLETLPALRAKGVVADACFLGPPHAAAAQLEANGVRTYFLAKSRLDPRGVGQVAAIMRRGQYQIVQATQYKSTLVARRVARKLQRRAVIHVHDLHTPPRPVGWLGALLAHQDDYAVCTSQAARQVAVNCYSVPSANVRVCYPGVDPAPFIRVSEDDGRALRAELGVSQGRPIVAMVARFFPVKGHRGMLDVFARLLKRAPDTLLLMAGDGPERAPCEALARSLGVADSVLFLGNREDVPRILAACNVVAVPSLSEGLGLAAVEANLCGRSVVGFRTGGLPEVVSEEVCGRLVPQGDHEAFAAALAEQLAHPSTEAAAAARRQLASERFSVAAHVDSLRALYGAMLS